MLESESAKKTSGVAFGPDSSACFGLGLSFGLKLGFEAARMAYHAELARDVQAAKRYRHTGRTSKPSWQSQHPEEAKRLISDVLTNVLKENASWDSASKSAGVRTGIEGSPNYSTVMRMVLPEIKLLLDEIDQARRESPGKLEAACKVVAQARKKLGYDLSERLLEKLVALYQAGELPGRSRGWPDSRGKGKVSKEFEAELNEMNRDHNHWIGNVIGLAIAAYEEE